MHWYHTHYFGMHFIWWLLLIVVLVWVFSTQRHGNKPGSEKETPLDILKKRFANGEINEAEYEAKRKILNK